MHVIAFSVQQCLKLSGSLAKVSGKKRPDKGMQELQGRTGFVTNFPTQVASAARPWGDDIVFKKTMEYGQRTFIEAEDEPMAPFPHQKFFKNCHEFQPVNPQTADTVRFGRCPFRRNEIRKPLRFQFRARNDIERLRCTGCRTDVVDETKPRALRKRLIAFRQKRHIAKV